MMPLRNDADPTFQLPTLRQLVTPLFRHRTAVLGIFAVSATAVILAVSTLPRIYEAEMRLLVNRERQDSVMSADPQLSRPMRGEVTDVDLNGEVELIQSREVLEHVIETLGTDKWLPEEATQEPAEARLALAVAALRDDLTVEPVSRTTMIRIAYRSREPQFAARVLEQLSAAYLEKHLTVRRPAGAYDFFTEQARRYDNELRAGQEALAAFAKRERVVEAATEKEILLHKLSEFDGELDHTEATIADLSRRLEEVDSQMRITPDRHVTQVRDAGNIELLRGLKSEVLQLEMTRDEMLTKFTPEYPPVVLLDERLARLREAQSAAERTPLRDETTDQNPTSQWLRTEAARVRTERAALIARAGALRRTVADYANRAAQLDRQSVEQGELLRAVKTAEENQALYRRKQEEARVSDALDRTRIANVTVAEAPAVPQAPSGSRRRILFAAGMLLTLTLSLGGAYVLDALGPRFYTPEDVTRALDIPVLATTAAD